MCWLLVASHDIVALSMAIESNQFAWLSTSPPNQSNVHRFIRKKCSRTKRAHPEFFMRKPNKPMLFISAKSVSLLFDLFFDKTDFKLNCRSFFGTLMENASSVNHIASFFCSDAWKAFFPTSILEMNRNDEITMRTQPIRPNAKHSDWRRHLHIHLQWKISQDTWNTLENPINTIASVSPISAFAIPAAFGRSSCGRALCQLHGMRFMKRVISKEKSPDSETAGPFSDKTLSICVNQDTFV